MKPIRLTKAQAAAEFGCHCQTLSGRLRRRGILAGPDGKFSIRQICVAVYGDLEMEKLKKLAAERRLAEATLARTLHRWVPLVMVDKVWSGVTMGLRQRILAAELPQAVKQDLVVAVRDVDPDEYQPLDGEPTREDDLDGQR